MTVFYAVSIIAGFFSGSVLYGYLLPKVVAKIDVCEKSEDENPGTFNAIKYAGLPIGLTALALDISKGFIPVWYTNHFLGTNSLIFVLSMLSPVLGHAFSPFRHFKGGKAIAVSFGVLLGCLPKIQVVWGLAFLYILFSLFKIHPHERLTIITFICFAIIQFLIPAPLSVHLGGVAIFLVVIYKNYI